MTMWRWTLLSRSPQRSHLGIGRASISRCAWPGPSRSPSGLLYWRTVLPRRLPSPGAVLISTMREAARERRALAALSTPTPARLATSALPLHSVSSAP